MTTTNQTTFDLTTQAGWDQFRQMLISTLGEDLQGRLNSSTANDETDDNKSEVQRRAEEERHRQHLARVKELETDNRRRNPGR